MRNYKEFEDLYMMTSCKNVDPWALLVWPRTWVALWVSRRHQTAPRLNWALSRTKVTMCARLRADSTDLAATKKLRNVSSCWSPTVLGSN